MKKIFFSIIFLLVIVSISGAEPSVLGLPQGTDYDIYLASSEAGALTIQDVEIIGFREIKGMTFLVIHTDSFEGKRSEALLRWDHIHAVIPTNKRAAIQAGRIYR